MTDKEILAELKAIRKLLIVSISLNSNLTEENLLKMTV